MLNQNRGKRAYSKNLKTTKKCNIEKRSTITQLFVAVRPRHHPLLIRLNFSCQCN